ncbi:hypothetical protein, partial [Burkholderia lata]|uniref:hypothetical protein n=1 Tax=Burkholderia lata (strain ATCC 17760 / DSM 23089 / LMG 22485 / NCIMB 9086 / R18194 / 383) TaxID=482957 RepID=UPI001E620497
MIGASERCKANPIGLICVSLAKAILENRHPGPSSNSSHATDPDHSRISAAQMQKPPPVRAGVLGLGSLTIT